MPADEGLFDPTKYDTTRPVLDIDAIRAINPHRHEMELLTAVVAMDPAKHLVAGYVDLTAGDFWCRGHMPGFPLLPGVLMCEAAAQLTGFYVQHQTLIKPGVLMGLGGIESAQFRRKVRPGERLLMIGQGLNVKSRATKFEVRGFVGTEEAFRTVLMGISLGSFEELKRA